MLISTPRVMIVESYGSNARSLSSHLRSLGLPLDIMTTSDAGTALEQLQMEPVDLAIIDTCLRGKTDGFELCRAIRASSSIQSFPIILLLAGYLSLERSKGILAGADLVLHRPVVKEELLKMIELLLEPRAHQRAGSPRLAAVEGRSTAMMARQAS